MIDLSKFPCHKKPYADSTLRNMRKGELIGILRDYEHNYGALYSFYENSVKNAEALLKQAERLTLRALLALLQPHDRAMIFHRLGQQFLETVANGTVQELLTTRCVEACGDNVIEKIEMSVEESPVEWVSEGVPILVVTIGGKAADA